MMTLTRRSFGASLAAGAGLSMSIPSIGSAKSPNEKLKWDSKSMRFTNNDKANSYVKTAYRTGRELEGL